LGVPPGVREAAIWLHLTRNSVSGNVIIALRRRFDLTVIEAVAASKLAHALDYGHVK